MLSFSELQELKSRLQQYWQPETEACGVVRVGIVFQCENLSTAPEDNFEFPPNHLEGSQASWHTHPSGQGNLSIPDYWFFKSWPGLLHFIISKTEVRCYGVLTSTVRNIDDQDDYTAWATGQSL
jgi:proteasome lid subunit RPN8/RPN11